jgi:hypothetical protein
MKKRKSYLNFNEVVSIFNVQIDWKIVVEHLQAFWFAQLTEQKLVQAKLTGPYYMSKSLENNTVL